MKVSQTIRQLQSDYGCAFANLSNPGKSDPGCEYFFQGLAFWGCMCMGEGGSKVCLYTRGIDWFLAVFDNDKVREEWEKLNPEWMIAWSEDRHAWKLSSQGLSTAEEKHERSH